MMRLSRVIKISLLLQVLGAAVLLLGCFVDAALYVCGLILLLPGSAIAAFICIPLGHLGYISIDRFGIYASVEDLGYLPIVLVLNLVFLFLAQKAQKLRA